MNEAQIILNRFKKHQNESFKHVWKLVLQRIRRDANLNARFTIFDVPSSLVANSVAYDVSKMVRSIVQRLKGKNYKCRMLNDTTIIIKF